MTDSNSSVEHAITEASVSEGKKDRISQKIINPLSGRIKNALQIFSPRDILVAAADQAAIEKEQVDKVLPEQEKENIGRLRVVANYLWDQKAVFGLMALYPTLELVKKFSGLDIPDLPLSVVNHGSTAAIGALTSSSGEGSLPSKILKKARGALGFSAGVSAIEHITGVPGPVVAAIDEPLMFGAKKSMEYVGEKTGMNASKIKEKTKEKMGTLKTKMSSRVSSGPQPVSEKAEA